MNSQIISCPSQVCTAQRARRWVSFVAFIFFVDILPHLMAVICMGLTPPTGHQGCWGASSTCMMERLTWMDPRVDIPADEIRIIDFTTRAILYKVDKCQCHDAYTWPVSARDGAKKASPPIRGIPIRYVPVRHRPTSRGRLLRQGNAPDGLPSAGKPSCRSNSLRFNCFNRYSRTQHSPGASQIPQLPFLPRPEQSMRQPPRPAAV